MTHKNFRKEINQGIHIRGQKKRVDVIIKDFILDDILNVNFEIRGIEGLTQLNLQTDNKIQLLNSFTLGIQKGYGEKQDSIYYSYISKEYNVIKRNY